MVYAPFVERFKDFFAVVKHYDMTQARPKLKEWIEVCVTATACTNQIQPSSIISSVYSAQLHYITSCAIT